MKKKIILFSLLVAGISGLVLHINADPTWGSDMDCSRSGNDATCTQYSMTQGQRGGQIHQGTLTNGWTCNALLAFCGSTLRCVKSQFCSTPWAQNDDRNTFINQCGYGGHTFYDTLGGGWNLEASCQGRTYTLNHADTCTNKIQFCPGRGLICTNDCNR